MLGDSCASIPDKRQIAPDARRVCLGEDRRYRSGFSVYGEYACYRDGQPRAAMSIFRRILACRVCRSHSVYQISITALPRRLPHLTPQPVSTASRAAAAAATGAEVRPCRSRCRPGINQSSLWIVITKQQRAEVRPRAFRIGSAGHHEFLAVQVLHLEPEAAPRDIVHPFIQNPGRSSVLSC
jgi:hypothetical protein